MNIETHSNPLSIYLAEDNPDHAELIMDMFDESGIAHQLYHFDNGAILLDFLSSSPQKADLILLDIKMPKMNGLTALEKIRSLPDYLKTTILIITTSTIKADVAQAITLGANAVITKPLSFNDLQKFL